MLALIIQYVSSLYWAVITMITIGYGDSYPVLTVEKISVIVIAMVSCGIFAYSISKIGSIVDQLNKREREFSEKMKFLKRYLKLRGVDGDNYHQIYKYFEYIHEERIEEIEQSEELMQQLTCNFRFFFQKNLSQKIKKSKTQKLKKVKQK